MHCNYSFVPRLLYSSFCLSITCCRDLYFPLWNDPFQSLALLLLLLQLWRHRCHHVVAVGQGSLHYGAPISAPPFCIPLLVFEATPATYSCRGEVVPGIWSVEATWRDQWWRGSEAAYPDSSEFDAEQGFQRRETASAQLPRSAAQPVTSSFLITFSSLSIIPTFSNRIMILCLILSMTMIIDGGRDCARTVDWLENGGILERIQSL